MRRTTICFGVAACLCACAPDDQPEAGPPPLRPAPMGASTTTTRTRAPTLRNREDVIRYRDEAARLLLPPGDSITVRVHARIDAQGIAHQPEIKDTLLDERLKGAAISVVQMMHFNPAIADGQPTSVLMTIPVRFVHTPAK